MTRRQSPQQNHTLLLLLVFGLLGGFVLLGTASDAEQTVSPDSVPVEAGIVDEDPDATEPSVPASTSPGTTAPGTVVDPAGDGDGCTVTMNASMRSGNSGADVTCLQQALIREGFLTGLASGVYDGATVAAVTKLQTERDMFVDGIAGRETCLSLGIWPDENANIIRTPVPPKGAKDLSGYPLSSVASAGEDAPPLPAKSGTGRRIVFDREGQRVWAVDAKGRIIRSWLISGSKYNNETPGTHKVYSRSEYTTAWNGKATLKYMVRWLKTDIGAIGFHQIPVKRSTGKVYQTEEELGSRLSGGCQRQAKLDAEFLWKFATVGTKVVVL
jgi:peptidoglycan hydrolase-like protein with peptidoglycan-binding domain